MTGLEMTKPQVIHGDFDDTGWLRRLRCAALRALAGKMVVILNADIRVGQGIAEPVHVSDCPGGILSADSNYNAGPATIYIRSAGRAQTPTASRNTLIGTNATDPSSE